MHYLIIALHLLCSPSKDSTPPLFPYSIKQPPVEFHYKNIEWNLPQRYKDSVIAAFCKKNELFQTQVNNHTEGFSASWHFVNLDGDKFPDVIYEGWSGGEGKVLHFYLNQRHGFRQAFVGQQYLIDLHYTAGRVSSFVISDPGCCAEIVEFERHFSVDTSFQCKLVLQRAILQGMSVGSDNYATPDGFFPQPVKFRIQQQQYALRYTPEIVDTLPNSLDLDNRERINGNIIAIYPAGYKGYAWAYKKDRTGREWWLVEMDPAVFLPFSRYWDYDDKLTHYFGWMSSRFVEKLP